MMTIDIDGERTELDLSDCATPEQVNARLDSLGLLQHVHAATPDELAEVAAQDVLDGFRVTAEQVTMSLPPCAYTDLAAETLNSKDSQ